MVERDTTARDGHSDDGMARPNQGGLTRPHPDRLIEAARPQEEEAKLYTTMDTIGKAILYAIAAVLAVLFLGLWLMAWAETGEACPGVPEGWLGYCPALEDR